MNTRPGDADKLFVLVHGSFHGAWAFEKLAPLLVREGHQVIARDLLGHGLRARFPRSYLDGTRASEEFPVEPSPLAEISLRDCADPVIATVEDLAQRLPERRIVLVGHSFAGLVLHAVGEAVPHHLDRLVYLNAFMTASGVPATEYLASDEFASSALLPLAIGDPMATGAFRIDPRSDDPRYQAGLRTTLADDVDDDTWQAVVNLLTPDTPAAPHAEPVTLSADRWGTVPRTYVSCTRDNAFPVDVHRRFVREADEFTPDNVTDVREMASSHSPFWSQPERLAELLLRL